MLFNSIDFAVFLPVVFILYWFAFNKSIRLQNFLIVIASYFFYGWWDWRFLSLIFLSTVSDYVIALMLSRQENPFKRKCLLWASMVTNLGLLGFFKYFNFFIDSFSSAFSFFGSEIPVRSLDIILPVGISFYTFQTMSYTIDVYRKKMDATNDFVAFTAFVAFFPQLVAGPIERASNLLPQFFRNRVFDYDQAVDGMRQIVWGLFKKIVIADGCARYANMIFNNSDEYSGSTLFLGGVFFAIQIYCDFSGYSDIAIGTSRLFGFNLMRNFAFPYFSRDIAEFWRRWHISLSTWFRDYLYIPLGGSKGGTWMKVRNTFVVFLVSGFWHGANWTFLAWGALNAVFFLPLLLARRNREHLDIVAAGRLVPSLRELSSMLITFCLTVFAWIFFRSESIEHAFSILQSIFSASLLSMPEVLPFTTLVMIAGFLLIEWLGREQQYAIAELGKGKLRYAMYYCLLVAIFFYAGNENEFIYFQF